MPKVNIYQPAFQGRDLETGLPLEPFQDRRISVGWARGQFAQIGVGWIDPQIRASALTEAATTSSSRFTVNAEADEEGRVWASQWLDLDRHTINQLIRELRKARDEAFGRDE
jgi:hypothetical protein